MASTKPNASKDNIEFEATQMVNILLQNNFPIDSTFILLELDEEEGSVARPLPITLVVRISKILGTHFWHAPIDVNEEMEDVKEINGMNTQLETTM